MTKLSITLRHPNDQTPPVGYVPGYQRAVTDPMTRAEECQAFEALRAGDESQRDRITQANLRFVFDVAKHFEGQGLDREDLVQEGICGMMVAVDKFDHTLGWKFISYAVHWIRQSIQVAISQTSTTVRLPQNVRGNLLALYRQARKMEKEFQRSVSNEEARAEVEVPDHVHPFEYHSLDAPKAGYDQNSDRALFSNASRPLLDQLSVEPEERTVEDELQAKVRGLLESAPGSPYLAQRERDILRAYFGFEGPPLTLEQIGAGMGITRERVGQLKEMALAKLRARVRESKAEMMEMVG